MEKGSKIIVIFYITLAIGLISWYLWMNYQYQTDLEEASKWYSRVWTQEINKSYQDILDRPANQTEIQHFTILMSEKKMNINDIRIALSYDKYIDLVYQETLNRTANNDEMTYYVNLLKNNKTTLEDIRQSLLNSEEGRNVQVSYQLDDLYKTILYRPINDTELKYYTPLLIKNQTTFDSIKKSILQSDEFKTVRYDNQYSEFVNDLYKQILHRDADMQGLDSYTFQLENKTMTVHDVRLALLKSQEHMEWYMEIQHRMEIEVH